MEPNRLGDGRAEPAAEQLGARPVVALVAAQRDIEGPVVAEDEMADVVQQRRRHQGVGRHVGGGHGRALQRVLPLGDGLVVQPVGLGPPVQPDEVAQRDRRARCHRPPFPWPSRTVAGSAGRPRKSSLMLILTRSPSNVAPRSASSACLSA